MTVWLLECGRGWDEMRTKDVFISEKSGLRKFNRLRRRACKRHGLRKVARYTYGDGSHASAWGSYRLRLRPVEIP